MSTATRAFVFAGVAGALISGSSISEEPKPAAYVLESYPGNSIVTGGYGQCWHTSYWTPEQSVEQCDAQKSAAAQPPATPAPPQAAPTPPPEPPKAAEQAAPPVTQPARTEEATTTPLTEPEKAPEPRQNPRLETALLPQTVHYSTDAFFDFDEATLRPEGRAALDELVGELAAVKYGSIRVVGHTDRIGSDDYNQQLSERRANAVKNYLARHNVPGDRIEAVGKGKSQPTADTRNCTGPKSPKVVKCLQPDRRVDIEVAGTKEGTSGTQ
jgi:OmpA-OmpF porin, OOP family